MRWLKRSLLFWAISAPLFYLFGLPYALGMLSEKAQSQAYDQCVNGLRADHSIGSPNSPITPEQGDRYCHCMGDGLIVTKADLFDIMKKQPPAALTALAHTVADQCNHQLQEVLGNVPSATPPIIMPQAPTTDTPDKDGVIHL